MYSPANQRGFMQTDGKYLQLNNLFIFKTRSNLSKHKIRITKQTPAQVGWDKKRQPLATLACEPEQNDNQDWITAVHNRSSQDY